MDLGEVVDRGCTMSGRNQAVVNRSFAKENLSVEIDPLGSDALAHVNTVVEPDDKRPNIALLAIGDEPTA